LMAPSEMTELDSLSEILTTTLQDYYSETAVKLAWRECGPPVIPFPTAQISLDDDGTPTPVDRTGHGLQRALIVTLLQHLAIATAARHGEQDEGDDEPPPLARPGLLLALEEPELYQHPTKQRHIARI